MDNTPCLLHLLDIHIRLTGGRLHPFPVSATPAALNAPMNRITKFKVPRKTHEQRLTISALASWVPVGHRSWNNSATFTKESVLICHQKAPQQIGHRPFLCNGLHLSLLSPHTRAGSGATWRYSSLSLCDVVASLAYRTKHWRTNRLKFGKRSAILAVSSSRLMVLLCPMTLPRLGSISTYLYLLRPLAYRPLTQAWVTPRGD